MDVFFSWAVGFGLTSVLTFLVVAITKIIIEDGDQGCTSRRRTTMSTSATIADDVQPFPPGAEATWSRAGQLDGG